MEGGWIIFLRQLAAWALQIFLQFFILIEVFEYSTIFYHFDTSIYSIALKRWNFPDNLEFNSKIAARYFIRNHFLSI